LESKARSSGVDWNTSLPEEDREVRCDSQRLAQALGNLVDNAIHALEGRDDPRIEISVSVGTDTDTWTLTVEDNGPGIPADDLPHVFRRFYRVGDDRGREEGGVGLGLSLVRAIAEAHGGEATIESRPGEGTQVTVSLPIG
jgi:signal transduction histidine kinase